MKEGKDLIDKESCFVEGCCEASEPEPIKEKPRDNSKLKVDIFVPLNACACEWSQFMNRVFQVLTPHIKFIDYDTKSLHSAEARTLNLRGNSVVIDGEKKYTSSFALEKDLPKLLKEKGLI